jgi:CO/xanthine dehydrogenase FAD-binding subunit
MIPPFDYRAPNTLKEACDLLWDFREEGKIIAGGTDLVIGLRTGDLKPRCLIDITRIEALRKVEDRENGISIGAGVTHSELASSPLIRQFGKVLSEAASWIGSPQIRNLGTLGGNIVNASPAADTLPPLMVLDAVGKIVSREGERDIPLPLLFSRPYETILKPHEILAQVHFPKLPLTIKSSFVRLARREAMVVARMSVAVIVQLERGRFEDVRISVGSVTPTPRRMSEAEGVLKGRAPDEESLKLAAHRVSETMVRQSGIRPSTSYKKPVIEALLLRAMRGALEG